MHNKKLSHLQRFLVLWIGQLSYPVPINWGGRG
jgi:hypothetical protein